MRGKLFQKTMMICFPNATPFPLGCKQPKKVQEQKEHNNATIGNKFTQAVNVITCNTISTQTMPHPCRSSGPDMFFKKGVLFLNFAKFTGKHLCQISVFNKVAVLRPATLMKKETLTQMLSCEFCEILRTPYFI